MQSRIHFLILLLLLVLRHTGRAELPDTSWLREFVMTSKGHGMDEMVMFAYRYDKELDHERIGKLRALLLKVAANGPELTVDDFVAASAALRLLGVAKAPGLVEAAIPFMQTSQNFVKETAAEVMAATGSEAAVEHLETAFQRKMKKWLSGDPWAVTNIGDTIRCFAINGTPKARVAYERSLRQVAEAVKSGTPEDRKWEREHIVNIWEEVEKEKAGKALPDPSEARRVGPTKPREQPQRRPLGNDAPQPNASAPVATVGKANESVPIPGGWALWGGIAALLAAAAGWLFLRGRRRGK